jgi:ATP-dependent DNA helicase DinG
MSATFDEKDIEQKLHDAGLQHRHSQQEMIACAYAALKDKKIACVEAPTGVGKTLAYGIAAMLAKEKGQKIVVSTATIALQDQLLHQDIPLLKCVLGRDIKAGIAKGRRRYVCLSRLYHLTQAVFSEQDRVQTLQESLESGVWNGERETLVDHIPAEDWQQISTDTSGCAAGHCEFFDDCVFYRARRKALSADVVITNHSLLLSDLALGGGVVLPPVKDCLYIIDECHHLPQKALSHFAKQAAIMRSIEWINTLNTALPKLSAHLKETDYVLEETLLQTKSLVQSLTLMQAALKENQSAFENDIWRLAEASDSLIELAAPIIQAAQQLFKRTCIILEALELLHKQKEGVDSECAALLSGLLSTFGFLQNRLENLALTWQLFCQKRLPKQPPIARWFDMKNTPAGAVDFTCHVSPINVSQDLQQLFWNKIEHGALLCSATICSLGSFDDYARKSGLKRDPRLRLKSLSSPFPYHESVLFVPSMQQQPVGKNQQAHLDEVISLLPELIVQSVGTLVLFTSRKAMETVFSGLSGACRQLILKQGDRGKTRLIRLHKRRVDQGKTAILFGLASFAEGLDLPGNYCKHVIIHKLPFAMPSDPIELTRAEWLKQNALDPFMLSMLPLASLRLTQYVGRLLRTEKDTGFVSILDRRLYTKRYGQQMLDGLPGFVREIDVTVADFKQRYLM